MCQHKIPHPGDFYLSTFEEFLVAIDIFKTQPFGMNIEWCNKRTEWVRGNSNDMQFGVECEWLNALLGWQTTHKMILLNQEAIQAINIFPGNGIEVVIHSNEYDTIGKGSKKSVSQRLRSKESIVKCLPIDDRFEGSCSFSLSIAKTRGNKSKL